MLDIGWSELLVVAVVAIVIVGPKELPRLMRTFGRYAGKLRRAASDFQRQFDEAMRESEAEEVRKNIENIRATAGSFDLKATLDKPVMLPKEPARSPPGLKATPAAPLTQAPKKPAKSKTPAPRPAKSKAAAKVSGGKRRKAKAERAP